MKRVEGKVDSCHRNLKWWSEVAFGNVTSLREIKDQLRVAEEATLQGGSMAWVHRLKKEISKLLVSEEQMWKNDLELYGCKRATITQDTFILGPRISLEEIELIHLKIWVGKYARMRMGLQIFWLVITKDSSPRQTQA